MHRPWDVSPLEWDKISGDAFPMFASLKVFVELKIVPHNHTQTGFGEGESRLRGKSNEPRVIPIFHRPRDETFESQISLLLQ